MAILVLSGVSYVREMRNLLNHLILHSPVASSLWDQLFHLVGVCWVVLDLGYFYTNAFY